MTAPFLLDEMSEESACLAGRSTYDAPLSGPRRRQQRDQRQCSFHFVPAFGLRASIWRTSNFAAASAPAQAVTPAPALTLR